jgi:hypothetical protein
VAEGEWRFDLYYSAVAGARVAFVALDLSGVGLDRPNDGYYIEMSVNGNYVRLYRSVGGSETRIGGYTDNNLQNELQQVIVNRDADGNFNVWVNGEHRISGQSTHHSTSAYFLVNIVEGGYIDNIVVYDEIVTQPPTTPTTPTNGTTPPPPGVPGFPAIAIAVGIVSALTVGGLYRRRQHRTQTG